MKRLRENIDRDLIIALRDVAALSDDERAVMRQSSSKGQQVALAAELEARIKTVNPDFHVVHLKKVTGLPMTKFDTLMQDLVSLVLRDELGANWYSQGVPEDFRAKISDTIRKRGLDVLQLRK